jgi:predicted metal-dependent phosphoesterase TrpH
MIDLHTHSTASDGSLGPTALIQKAADRGLNAIALTDHDTIDGLAEASAEAARLGMRFIPGIELEISASGTQDAPAEPVKGEFHLLGLGIHSPSEGFLQAVAELGRRREARNREILGRINEMGIAAEYAELEALSGGGSMGRPHFAALLVARRVVKTREQAFARYLGKGKPLYVPKAGLDFEEAGQLIRESGGIAVLAHPMSLYISWGRLPDYIKTLAEWGLQGLEAWHPTATVHACRRLEELGKALGLRITAGSDYHGEARPDRKLGLTAGGRKIEDAFLEGIPDAAPKAPQPCSTS